MYHLETGHKQSRDELLEGQESPMFTTSLTNEIGRLAQGIGKNRPANEKIEGTNTINFLKQRQAPRNA